jgi:hypothetical protein
MTCPSKPFDPRPALSTLPSSPIAHARAELAAAEVRCQTILHRATPPEAMSAAPIAPARAPQALLADFTVTRGGMRQRTGGHWQALSPIAAMVANARMRHAARDEAHGTTTPFIPPFNPAQVQVAEDYAALVEWREGSPLRCASLEPGRGGANGNPFIDSYIQNGLWLETLQARIGTGMALAPQRHMDRGNARKSIAVRVAVDMLCLTGKDLSKILQRFGWTPDVKTRKALRLAICGALDRMQGYNGNPTSK